MVYLRERGPDQPGFSTKPYSRVHVRLASHERATSRLHQPQEYVAHVLTARSGGGVSFIGALVPGGVAAVRRELQTLERPWNDLGGVARVALESRVDPEQSQDEVVEIVAPLGLSFDTGVTRLEAGELACAMWAGSKEAATRCSIGFITEYEDRSFRNGTLQLAASQWDGGSEPRGAATLSFGRGARRVTLLLRLGPHVVDTLELEDGSRPPANTRYLAAYEVVDPAFEKLRDALEMTEEKARSRPKGQGKKDGDSKELEHGVARLLSLAGFHADALDGYSGMTDAPDVWAHHPDGSVLLIVECTVGPLQAKVGKPSRLLQRAAQLRRQPALSGVEILPMMALGRRRETLSRGDLDSVALDRIAVLAQEDLLELLREVRVGASANDVVRFCRERIPGRSSDRSITEIMRYGVWKG